MWKWYQPISKEIFEQKYKFHRKNIEEVFYNIAEVVSSVEKNSEVFKKLFYDFLINNKFIPAGRILANAWPNSPIKNFGNCFTIGIEDSIEGIYEALTKDAKISKVGGGVGFDISTLRPEGSKLSKGGESSGPISFLKIFDQSAKVIHTGGSRRSAHIALMDISHPDIEKFIEAKREPGVLTQFNLSVKLTDKFIKAVEEDKDWDLVFNGKIYDTISARKLYDKLVYNAWKYSDPGIFNIDTVNYYNNGWYISDIQQCNPCGEEPLPVYKEYNNYGSVCNLGSMFLPSFVKKPFEDDAFFDFEEFGHYVRLAVRFMDNIIDVSEYPSKEINEIMRNERRIGLGFTGFADALAMMKIKYGSRESKEMSKLIASNLRDNAYIASVDLAREKGPFKWYNEKFLESNFVKKMPKYILENIKRNGIRNITLLTVAPNGTISLSIGNNCSSGIEPIFNLSYTRKVRTGVGEEVKVETVYDYAWLIYLSKILNIPVEEVYKQDVSKIEAPEYFVTTVEVDPKDAIEIQAVFQEYIDASISKTHSLKPGTTLEEYKDLFLYAYKKGLKGFTTFNPDYREGIINYHKGDKIIRKDAPKRPKDLMCDIHEISVKGKKFIVLVGKLEGKLYEVFVDCNDDGKVDVGKHKTGIIRKQKKGKYDLIITNGEEKIVIENISKSFDPTYGTLARLISTSLRHGVPLQFLVAQLSKSNNFLGFERAVNRVLKKYIKEGEDVLTSDKCPECGSKLVYSNGCITCLSCGWSKCD